MSGKPTGVGVSRTLRFAARYGYAAAASLYLFSVGWRRPRHRALISTISAHFGYADRRDAAIPAVDLAELVPENLPVQLREPHAVDGNVTLYELLAIVRMVQAFRPRRAFEIGTFDGRTTLNIAVNCDEGARVFTLDLPREELGSTNPPVESSERVFIDKDASGTRFQGSDCELRITQLFGDSARFDGAPYAGSIDFVFVDGSHAYEYVLSDSALALQMLTPGGVVVWHDYGVWDGVTRGLNELFLRKSEFASLVRVRGTSLVVRLPSAPPTPPLREGGIP